MKYQHDYELKKDGNLIFTGSENECYYKLQSAQSQSADWAMKNEGWTIEKIDVSNENLTILREREAVFNKIKGPRVGDWLELPYGITTRFTHLWDKTIQTGLGSFYLGSNVSHSGGLDSGVKRSDLIETEKKEFGSVWFFSNNEARAHNGIYLKMKFRVFKLKEGADTSGVPAVKEHEKSEIRKKAETITRVNGNGNRYILPVPEICIVVDYNKIEALKTEVDKVLSLEFEKMGNCLIVQPMTKAKTKEIIEHLESLGYFYTYYNNGMYKNTLIFTTENKKPHNSNAWLD